MHGSQSNPISALFDITQSGELVVKEKALQNAIDASKSGVIPGGLPSRAISGALRLEGIGLGPLINVEDQMQTEVEIVETRKSPTIVLI